MRTGGWMNWQKPAKKPASNILLQSEVYALTAKENTFTAIRLGSVKCRSQFCIACSGTGWTGHLQHDFYARRIWSLDVFFVFSLWRLVYLPSLALRRQFVQFTIHNSHKNLFRVQKEYGRKVKSWNATPICGRVCVFSKCVFLQFCIRQWPW